ncbi:MAG: PAS domain S-box protein [Caldilineaceae bacterium]|nr:PAS domain S-box protein [Caldilineaceae bacterium]
MSHSGSTQAPPVTPPTRGLPYRVKRISSEQGLSSTDVQNVLRDRQGFLWFGTLDGLNRYDGYKMKVFKNTLTDPTSLSESTIRTMMEDRAGTLWIGTWFGGLNRYDRATETFTRFQHDPADPTSLSSNSVYAILEDPTGMLWLGTRGGGLNRFDPVTGGVLAHYRHDPDDPASLGNDNIYALAQDEDGAIWLATDEGLDRFDPATETFRHYRHDAEDAKSLSDDLLRSLLVDDSGVVWAGTGDGLNRFDRASDSFVRYYNEADNPQSLSNSTIKSLGQASDGALWIGTWGGGPNRLDPQTGAFQRLGTDAHDPWALDATAINGFLEDDGLLWMATGSDVFVLDLEPKRFYTFQHEPDNTNSLAANEIDAIYEDPQGILWVSTASTGLNRIDRATGEVTHFQDNPADPASSSANEIWEIAPTGDGRLWLATFGGGLLQFDPETGESIAYHHNPDDPASLGSDRTTSVLRDRSGIIWVGTWDAGLDRYDPATGIFSHFPYDPADPTSLSDNAVMMVTADRNGDLWIGTLAGGLNRFDRATGSFTRYQSDAGNPQSLPANGITAVLLDQAGRLWVGALGGGLAHLNTDTGEAVHYNIADGLPSDSVFSILEDDRGQLWLSTSNGLSRFEPDAETFRNYDMADGLPGNVFEASTAFQSSSGEMFFGASNGLLAFYPDQIRDNLIAPPVVITDLLLANNPVPIGGDSVLQQAIDVTDALTLSYLDQVISFEFAALDYNAPQKNRYRYRLEGFDQAWTEVGSDRRLVTYTNLDPGDYTLRVVGSNNDGVWNETGAALSLIITPPWWETLWFRITAGVLVIGLITGAFVGQRRQAAAQQHKLEAMVVKRTRELQDAQTQISTLFDSSPLGICVTTLEGTILGANRALQRIAGYAEEELLQSDVRAFYAHPEQREPLLNQLHSAGFVSDYGILLRRHNGSPFYANLNLSRLEMGGQEVMVGIIDDITEQVQAREALAALNQVSVELAAISDLQTLLEQALQHLHKVLDFQHAVLLLVNDDEKASTTLYAYLAAARSPALTTHVAPVNSWSFLRTILDIRVTTYVPDIRADATVQAALDSLEIEGWAAVLKASRSWLCTPLIVGERTLGMLNLVHDAPDHFAARTIDVARTFTNQLAVVIDNVHLNEQALRAAAADERSRIARELHDSVTQTLFTASMMAESTPLIWEKNQSIGRQNMHKLSLLLRSALAEMRSLLLELRDDALPPQELGQLLTDLADATRARGNATVSTYFKEVDKVPTVVTMTFYRIAQEALNNIIKHAEATKVELTAHTDLDGLTLRIRDNGRGFDPQAIPAGHIGLSIMAERVEKIGGNLQIQSAPGRGATILVTWADTKGGRHSE